MRFKPTQTVFNASNSTTLMPLSLAQSIIVAGLAITCLITLVNPQMTATLSLGMRSFFWLCHVFIGLIGVALAILCVRYFVDFKRHLIVPILLSGLIGAFFVAPLYYLMEFLFSLPTEVADDALDEFALTGLGPAIVVEYIEVLPTFMVVWLIVNAPVWFSQPALKHPPEITETPTTEIIENNDAQRELFLTTIPSAIGQDIVSISSELHYLNIETTVGKALILGSLRKVAILLEEEGFLVHRSHWVHKNHVQRIANSGTNSVCIMSTGTAVPISRSKRKLVKDYFGDSVRAQ